MYNKDLRKFLRKLSVYSLPAVLTAVVYLIADPFKTTWHYDSYYDDNVAHVCMNMDYVSVENFVNRNPAQNYNAFIFGNSRSQYWPTEYWKKYIGEDSRCYHFYGNGETLYALENNLKFIHGCGNKIDHALLIVDTQLLSETKPRTGHMSATPPRMVGYRNVVSFHVTNFLAFLQPVFAYACLDLMLTRELKPYMVERYLIEQPVIYHPNSNEVVDQMLDIAIDENTYYTPRRMLRFQDKQHPDSVSPQVLLHDNIVMLKHIAQILRQHHTQYKVVVSPLYDQIKFNPDDLRTLGEIFGNAHVYDFSGKSTITSDYHHYYEDSHYRPVIARMLMDSIYSKQAK